MTRAELTTPRLVLRPLAARHVDPLTALHADADVMTWLDGPLDRSATAALIDRAEAHWQSHGFGLYAVESGENGSFLGFVGLLQVSFEAAFTPAVEVSWRLVRRAWGKGFASEAARCVIGAGFTDLGLDEVVAFTVPENRRSRAVMERLGMRHDPALDFDHPRRPPGHPLCRHVLYRLPASRAAETAG